MSADKFNGKLGITDPYTDAVVITPSDSVEVEFVTRGLYVGSSGDLTVITKDGTTVTLVNMLAGTYIPLRVSQVKATGTTASNILGLY